MRAAAEPSLEAGPFAVVDRRYSGRDDAWMFYLRAPRAGGDYELTARGADGAATVSVQVRSLVELRRPTQFNGAWWPRRWPLGAPYRSRRTRQTLQTEPLPERVDEDAVAWWTSQDDESLWRQLPDAEQPRAHYVNVHQGCPRCGTAIFAFHGFYPWTFEPPWQLRAECPSCGAAFPSNDLTAGDFSSGESVDDGFGYFDADGHVFLFAATARRGLVGRYPGAVRALTNHLRLVRFDDAVARQLGLLLLRWSAEDVYVAAAPQFRHGPSQEIEKPWEGGQPDWAADDDPVAALERKGLLCYAIDVPGVAAQHALAYDTVWPLLRHDEELVERARRLGLDLDGPQDAANLVEESLAAMVQCAVDGGALSNKPRTSLGTLTALRALDRPDAGDVMDWLYDRGPDRLRVFVSNNFTPDGSPPEANGGYNDTHTRGVFELEHELRHLRQLQPEAYPASRFPSLTDDPRLERVVHKPYEMTLLGRACFSFGDGNGAAVQTRLSDTGLRSPLEAPHLDLAVADSSAPSLRRLRDEVRSGADLQLGTTVHDGVGFAILRTAESPERAAAGIVYGDAPWHRHQDLLDVQLFAHERPFLGDLGYPQSWASIVYWEGDWSTHNTVWGIVPEVEPLELPFDTPFHFCKQVAGRGRLVRLLQAEGVQVVEVEARRWAFDPARLQWFDPGVVYRRLLALVETDADGVALVDLTRVRGGREHWRTCRGLESDALRIDGATQQPLPGTLAGLDVERGDLERIDHGDRRGLAWMDRVARVEAPATWRGTWSSRHEPGVHLDLHQLRVDDGTRLHTARAAATMAAPEASGYRHRAAAWSRQVAEGDSSCFDLLFEPRLGGSLLAEAEPIAATGDDEAGGVRIVTRAGRRVHLYWAPDADPAAVTRFEDGTCLHGALAVVATEPLPRASASLEPRRLSRSPRVTASGSTVIESLGHAWRFDQVEQSGTITALDRAAFTVDVVGLRQAPVGERLCINPGGRARSYRIESARPLAEGLRLQLDVTSVLGRARVAAVDGCDIELDAFLVTRTAYLRRARLQRETDDAWQVIDHAANRDGFSTVVRLASPLSEAEPGQWVAAVDYVVGDAVTLTPARRGEAP